ncbi:MAG: hypothetical protein ACRD37_05560 [Candidatus Acidiferrales bacterium]
MDKYPFTDPRTKCTWTVLTSTGSKMEARGTCMPSEDTKADFSMRLDALDSENVKGMGQVTVTAPAGSMNGNYTATAKWIGATCPAGMK